MTLAQIEAQNKLKSKNLLALQESLRANGMASAEINEYLGSMSADEMDELNQNLNQIDVTETTRVAKPATTVLASSAESLAAGLGDPSAMSSAEMRSYAESVAQAAEVVNNESDADAARAKADGQVAGPKKSAASGSKGSFKAQAAGSVTRAAGPAARLQAAQGSTSTALENKLLDQEQKGMDLSSPDLEAKAAIVAQAEAANAAALEGAPVSSKKPLQSAPAKADSLEALDADQKQEKQE